MANKTYWVAATNYDDLFNGEGSTYQTLEKLQKEAHFDLDVSDNKTYFVAKVIIESVDIYKVSNTAQKLRAASNKEMKSQYWEK